MSDAAVTPDPGAKPTDAAVTAQAQAAGKAAAESTANEWKPEPRQWTWKDLFTAPMLAFKPKCMLVSAVTLIVVGLWNSLFGTFNANLPTLLGDVVWWLWLTVALVIFSLGATLVAVFMKADLLDDEFLSFGEALGQYRTRLAPAVMVPVFLMGLLGGFYVLIALPELIGSIPYAGPTLYALLYPLGFLLGLFVTLLLAATILAVFVFPAIIAIRKHGWFDNVVDTFEAVGTKPHILVGSFILFAILFGVSRWVAFGGMNRLNEVAVRMPSQALEQTESQAAYVRRRVFNDWSGPIIPPRPATGSYARSSLSLPELVLGAALNAVPAAGPTETVATSTVTGWNKITGTVTGIWQILIGALIFGYCLNLFIGSGMLTYLVVREDDYWDDEDLEDLDQLAKELEEEAKQDAAKAGASSPAAPPAPAAPVTAQPPPAATGTPPAPPA